MSDESGGGDGGTIDVEGDDAWLARVGTIDMDARKALEEEGHALFLAGKFDEEAERDLRARLLPVCAGIDYKVDQSVLTATSPTGKYWDNEKVIAGEV